MFIQELTRSKTEKHSLITSFHDLDFSDMVFITSQNSSKSIWWFPRLSASLMTDSRSTCFGSIPRLAIAFSSSSKPIAPLLSVTVLYNFHNRNVVHFSVRNIILLKGFKSNMVKLQNTTLHLFVKLSRTI